MRRPSCSLSKLSTLILVFLTATAPALACAACMWGSFGPNVGSFIKVFLVWLIGVLLLTDLAHRKRRKAGLISAKKSNPAWTHAILFFAILFLLGAFIGPLAFFLVFLVAGVSSLSSLRAPMPVPVLVLMLHGALIAGFAYLGEAQGKQIEQAGGQEIWTLIHQRPHSRDVQMLFREKSLEELEELLLEARSNPRVPEEMLTWFETQVESTRMREESQKKELEDKRIRAELKQREREREAQETQD